MKSRASVLFGAVVRDRGACVVAALVGVHHSTVSRWCSGKKTPSRTRARALEALFAIPAVLWRVAPPASFVPSRALGACDLKGVRVAVPAEVAEQLEVEAERVGTSAADLARELVLEGLIRRAEMAKRAIAETIGRALDAMPAIGEDAPHAAE